MYVRTYVQRVEIGERSTKRKWVIRVFARTSADHSEPRADPPVQQCAINYAN